jgi:hypothetical protein
MGIASDEEKACREAGSAWAEYVWEKASTEERSGDFPRPIEQAAVLYLPAEYQLRGIRTAAVDELIYRAACARWAELVLRLA